MKKLSLLLLGSALSASVFAAPANTFTGATVGAEIGTTKYSIKNSTSGLDAKNAADVNLKGGYGFQYGASDFVGEVEGKVKLGSSKAFSDAAGDIKERSRYSIGYAQGYRVTPDLMPYAKVAYQESRFKDVADGARDTLRGFGVGVGAKYALLPNVELNAEYMNTHLRSKTDSAGERTKLRGNTVSAGVAYRF